MRTLLAAILAGLLTIAAATTVIAQGPYGGENLPAGVLSLTVAGQKLSLVDRPSTSDRQPVIAGTVDKPAGSTIVLGVASQSPINATVAIGAGGAFSARVAQPLSLGQHEVFIDGADAGTFDVTGTPPAPPAVGSGSASGADAGMWLFWVAFFGAISALILAAARRFRRGSNLAA